MAPWRPQRASLGQGRLLRRWSLHCGGRSRTKELVECLGGGLCSSPCLSTAPPSSSSTPSSSASASVGVSISINLQRNLGEVTSSSLFLSATEAKFGTKKHRVYYVKLELAPCFSHLAGFYLLEDFTIFIWFGSWVNRLFSRKLQNQLHSSLLRDAMSKHCFCCRHSFSYLNTGDQQIPWLTIRQNQEDAHTITIRSGWVSILTDWSNRPDSVLIT